MTQQRVLGLLYGQPGRSFFATEIIRLVDLGSGAVQRELKRLQESGLVIVSRVGVQKHYQANPAGPVFNELCGLIRKTVGLAEPVRDALSPLEKSITLAVIYGSVAKGVDTTASDVDLLIVSDDLTLERIYTALQPAERELERPIHPVLLTNREFQRRVKTGSPFLTKLMKGDHMTIIGSTNAIGRA